MVTLEEYFAVMEERPRKLTEEDVEYQPAPEGSAFRCASCINYYRRAIDGHAVCQVMRSERTDDEGVFPDWRCGFWTATGDVFPFQEPEETPPVKEEEENIPY